MDNKPSRRHRTHKLAPQSLIILDQKQAVRYQIVHDPFETMVLEDGH